MTRGAGRPLGEEPGDDRTEAEPGGERDRGSPRAGLLARAIPVAAAGELFHPGGTGREDGPAAGSGQEPAHVQQCQIVAAEHQDHRGDHREHHGRTRHLPAAMQVRGGPAEQQRWDQTESVDPEEGVGDRRGDTAMDSVREQQRRKLVSSPANAQQTDGGSQPKGQPTRWAYNGLLVG